MVGLLPLDPVPNDPRQLLAFLQGIAGFFGRGRTQNLV